MKTALVRMLRHQVKALGLVTSRAFPWLMEQHLEASAGILRNPFLAAKFLPDQPESNYYIKRAAVHCPEGTVRDPNGLPVPSQEDTEYKFGPEKYLSSGQSVANTIRGLVESSGFSLDTSGHILEFGCADARVLRWFHDLAGGREIWGVDINQKHIMNNQKYLSPPFRFATTTTFRSRIIISA
jgi:hypothetical protein